MIAAKQQQPLFTATTTPRVNQRNTNPVTTTETTVKLNKVSPRSVKKSNSNSNSIKDGESVTVNKQSRSVEEVKNKKCPGIANSAVQSVPFLQRKFNIFGGTSSSAAASPLTRSATNNRSLRSSARGSTNKTQATTLPRSSATKSSVEVKSKVQTSVKGSSSPASGNSEKTSKVKREDSENSDTFKGVQSLKQFWNSRIIGGGAGNNKSTTASGQTNSVAKSKFRKGVESVVDKTVSLGNHNNKSTKSEEKKPVSATVVKRGDEIDNSRVSATAQVTLRQSSSATSPSFAKSDNFNKYKTASSVKLLHNHRVSYNDLAGVAQRNSTARGSTRQQQQQTKRHTVDSASVCIPGTTKQSAKTTTSTTSTSTTTTKASTSPEPAVTVSHNRSTLKFPQIATTAGGSKIHWPKREDILETCKNRRKSLELTATVTVSTTAPSTMIKDTETKESPSTLIAAKTATMTDTKKVTSSSRREDEEREKKNKTIVNITMETATPGMQGRESSPVRSEKDLIMDSSSSPTTPNKTEESRSATPSSISLASMTVSSNGGGGRGGTDSPRKMNSTRKASFKTHSGQSQSIRKLAVGSKVAALTHRFNQLIQTDATIMEEVKRKGVVVHRVNGHVYKIKEDPATGDDVSVSGKNKKSVSRTASSTGEQNHGSSGAKNGLRRRKSSVKKHDPMRKSNSSNSSASTIAGGGGMGEKKGVKATIEMFEPVGSNNSGQNPTKRNQIKPKVPDKSEQVLKRTKELVSTRRDGGGREGGSGETTPSRLSLRLDEIKEVLEEKTLTPIQEALPPMPEVTKESSESAKNSLKKDKSVYGRIYEKIKLNKSSFLYSRKAPPIPSAATTPTLQISEPVLNSSTYDLRDPVPLTVTGIKSPEQKIFEALETVDRKIETLYKSSIELNVPSEEQPQNLKPNQSFLFRSTSTASNKSSLDLSSPSSSTALNGMMDPCAALNVSLIKSKTTMSMDERNFPFICRAADQSHSVSTSDLLSVPLLSLATASSSASASTLNDGQSEAKQKKTGSYEIRNEYQEIINETDKLIRRMNETYGSDDNIGGGEDGTHHHNRGEADDDEDGFTVVNLQQTTISKKEENNYDLYEQITSELEAVRVAAREAEETRAHSKAAAATFTAARDEVEEDDEDEEESIYQTVTEVKSAIRQAAAAASAAISSSSSAFINQHDEASVNSYESCDNYEAIDELRRNYREEQQKLQNGYEICEPEPPEPPPPRKISTTSAPFDVQSSSAAAPQLPVPKRNKGSLAAPLPKSTFYAPAPTTQDDEEEDEHHSNAQSRATRREASNSMDIFHSEHVYEENIYDTIKSADNTSLLSNNYESISLIGQSGSGGIGGNGGNHALDKSKSGDTMSYMSNCYESLRGSTLTINHLSNGGGINPGNKFGKSDYYGAGHGLRHSESVSTLSSDHKTNSIYGTTMHYGGSLAMNPGDRNSIATTTSLNGSPLGGSDNEVYTKMKHPPSENGTLYSSSDNSDEWVDISDGEGDGAEDQTGAKHKLIIVRERVKNHRSTTSDWNAKIREQRFQQIQHSQYYDDDSDHHYESMYAGDNYENQEVQRKQHHQPNHQGPGPAPQTLDIIPFDDDEFDSFDSDLETDEDVKKNDSGVDVSNTRLPDPPASSNQVYALMQKFKTLSSLSEISKSLSRFATKKRSPKHPSQHHHLSSGAESASNLYQQGTSKAAAAVAAGSGTSSTTTTTSKKKNKSEPQSNSQFYANTDFHTLRKSTNNLAGPLTSTPISGTIVNSQLPLPPTPTESVSSPPTPTQGTGVGGVTINSTSTPSFGEYTGVAPQQMPVPLARKKSKGGKSFKSKLRRSLVPDTSGSSLSAAFSTSSTTKSTFYVNDSPDMDSGIFTGSDKTLKMEENSLTSINKDNSFTDLVNEIKTRNAKNAASSAEDMRRRSIATSRPLSPPPAPPVLKGENNVGLRTNPQQQQQRKTSWYDECGVFKPDPTKEMEKKASMTNWYADSGLYQTSGDSVTSSSGSSGVSTGGECNGTDDNSHSMFCNEPLYQIYSAAKLESITRDMEMETDGYEEIGKNCPTLGDEERNKKPVRPTALQLVSPRQGPSRMLWSEIPEVINSEILSTLTPTEKRVQEAKFEIITSEASYLKSLNLLKSHFMNHPAFRDVNVLSAADRKTLFSYTIPVLDCSEKLLTDLENCWQDNIMLIGLSHSIFKHAENSFKVYVNYCEHQVRLDRILKKLKESNKKFCEILEQLELNPMCCGLSFHSFLMLPMQRITRLPLLIDAVLSKLKPDDDEFENWRLTLAMLNKIVSQCNEAANKCEQIYEMQYISRQIEFPSDITPLPIVPMGIPAPNSRRRALVRRGEMVHLIWRGDDGKLTFGKKFSKSQVYVFLFTDLLVLTKRKSDDTYLVFDYCCRSMLTVSSGDVIPQLPTKEVAMAGKHLILMTLLENHHGKTVELILSCESETDRTRWLKATEPPLSENPDETLYEQWDCPQVTTLHAYQAKQPDELSLDVGDVVNVTRKMADGWYHGERIRDGEQGWFPGNYTEEVASPHVRARNLKQRYRLLTFTANYLESQKKK